MAITFTLRVSVGEPFRLDDLCPSCWCASTWAQLFILGLTPEFAYTCTNCEIVRF
jgi:hypothetical protein